MNTMRSSPQFVKDMNGLTQPSGSAFGYLLVTVIAIFLIGANTYGFAQATGLPPLIGLTVAILAFVIRMYMIRRRSPYERVTSSGLERAMLYLPAAIISTMLSAFTIHSLVVNGEKSTKRRAAEQRLEHGAVVIENYYRNVRAKIISRLETIDERLRELDNQLPAEQNRTEIVDLEQEQATLRELFRETVTAVRPLAPNSPDDVGSAQEKLSRKFDEAASFHRQLPDSIVRDIEAPRLENPPEDATSGHGLKRFFRDLAAMNNEAMGCLAAPIILEIFVVTLVISNRTR